MSEHESTSGQEIISWVTRAVILVAFVIGIIVCFYMIRTGDLTSRETGLLSVVLTVLSILATWVVGHIYSESQLAAAIAEAQRMHKENLRTYALKAAEKVNNLSNELVRLSTYLESELESDDCDNTAEALRSKVERIDSAIHVLQTLKSVNDTSLSDWEGVIGDELDQQREEQREREEELRDAVLRLEQLVQGYREEVRGSQAHADYFRAQIFNLKRELQFAIRSTGLASISRKRSPKTLHEVTTACPNCGHELSFRQRPKVNGLKALKCKNCDCRLISRSVEGGSFEVELREIREERFACPDCERECAAELDTFPGGEVAHVCCEQCGATLRVSRGMDGLRVHHMPRKQTQGRHARLTDDLLERVLSLLPAQPWPKGVHQQVAQKMGVKAGVVTRAIAVLISRGKVSPQIDGVVYVPKDQPADSVQASSSAGSEYQREQGVPQGAIREETTEDN